MSSGSTLCLPCRAARPTEEDDGFVLSAPSASPNALAMASVRPLNVDFQHSPLSPLKTCTLHAPSTPPKKRTAVKNPYENYKLPPRARTPTPTAFAPGFHLPSKEKE